MSTLVWKPVRWEKFSKNIDRFVFIISDSAESQPKQTTPVIRKRRNTQICSSSFSPRRKQNFNNFLASDLNDSLNNNRSSILDRSFTRSPGVCSENISFLNKMLLCFFFSAKPCRPTTNSNSSRRSFQSSIRKWRSSTEIRRTGKNFSRTKFVAFSSHPSRY